MKAEELRIGSKAIYTYELFDDRGDSEIKNDVISISEIRESGSVCAKGCFFGLIDIRHLTPIPLTVEWHLKFGARKRTDKRFSHKVSDNCCFDFIWDKTKFEWWVEYVNGNIISPMPAIIKYVHELQNFWRANTGKELTYK